MSVAVRFGIGLSLFAVITGIFSLNFMAFYPVIFPVQS